MATQNSSHPNKADWKKLDHHIPQGRNLRPSKLNVWDVKKLYWNLMRNLIDMMWYSVSGVARGGCRQCAGLSHLTFN